MIPKYLFDDLVDAHLPFKVTLHRLEPDHNIDDLCFGVSATSKGQAQLTFADQTFKATPEELLHRLNALLYAGTVKAPVLGQQMQDFNHATGRQYAFRIDADIPETVLAKPQAGLVCHVRILYAQPVDLTRSQPATATLEVTVNGKPTLHTISIFDAETLVEISRISRYSAPRDLLTKLIENAVEWNGRPSVGDEYVSRYGNQAYQAVKPIDIDQYLADSPLASFTAGRPATPKEASPKKKAWVPHLVPTPLKS